MDTPQNSGLGDDHMDAVEQAANQAVGDIVEPAALMDMPPQDRQAVQREYLRECLKPDSNLQALPGLDGPDSYIAHVSTLYDQIEAGAKLMWDIPQWLKDKEYMHHPSETEPRKMYDESLPVRVIQVQDPRGLEHWDLTMCPMYFGATNGNELILTLACHAHVICDVFDFGGAASVMSIDVRQLRSPSADERESSKYKKSWEFGKDDPRLPEEDDDDDSDYNPDGSPKKPRPKPKRRKPGAIRVLQTKQQRQARMRKPNPDDPSYSPSKAALAQTNPPGSAKQTRSGSQLFARNPKKSS